MMQLIAELRRVNRRYMARHARFRCPAMSLHSVGGEIFGYLEECTLSEDMLTLRGWTLSQRLCLEVDGNSYPVPRRIQRGDVLAALKPRLIATGNHHGRVGFKMKVPPPISSMQLVAQDVSDAGPWPLQMPTESMMWMERRRTQIAFVRDFLKASPIGIRYLLTGRRQVDRERLRSAMGFQDNPDTCRLLDPRVLEAPLQRDEHFPATTIILPVYNAFELLVQAIDRVERHTDVPWHLILIEDASPDPRVRPWLLEWAAQRPDRVTLLLNETNLGFIGSVNRGMAAAAARGGPVILLNSDALVPKNWASRLLQPIVKDRRVASVTPMSNDATIMSVPWIAGQIALEPGMADVMDATARTLSPQARARIPTGVGFCMAMSRAALNRVPALDPAFGRGYGEEVDWCRKTAAAGMIHVGVGNLFVEHRGGESFGSVNKIKALETSARTLRMRYPEFDDEVQHFIAADPLLTARLCLALARAATMGDSPLHIYIGHSLGGGAEHWLTARIEARGTQGKPSVVIRVGGSRRFRIELHADSSTIAGETDNIDLVRRLILRLPRRRVIYSCGVGDERPWELPGLLCDLASDKESILEILFHDYFPVSPSLNLLNADGSYTGVPAPDSVDIAHQISAGEEHVPLWQWRQAWGAAIDRAERLTVFSDNSADLVAAAWPEACNKIVVRPHQPLVQIGPFASSRQDGKEVLGILGAIGEVKGAQVVSDLAHYLNRLPDPPRLVVVGEFDHSFSLPPTVQVTGRYDPTLLRETLASHNITAWLMPSIWPETFSFTTREMLSTGLPVMAFDLGAQGDAVRGAPNGYIVAPDPAAIVGQLHRLRPALHA